ncbi:alkaline shock response membrane anchor protein AmaP [Streptomyces sp. SL13]|uniref:Alkaline shock response membrane anchor protein AmaP n=1 Tax=Streptantibioticus silvisoli TaxID=2705255 RepID=A0AA90H344_9ACTN|nr:alkaline shock response membrane anchor protein AmaP [Streptantibioticus silvisoli]MDI5963092.1 alkaline shock response membrane anchor protein AmaP [Streptantibioticus silvisoli]MDI5973218.1 alkaline shock response membrane anchor protein AmaP [Streptantibioticus silvisoli]
MRTTVNRLLMGLIGAILFVVGGSVLVSAFDLPRHWHFTLPSWWPFSGPHDVLLTAADRTRYRGDSWWWPVVIAALAVIALAALWWLVAQLRTRRLGQVQVDYGEEGRVVLRGRALEDALAADAEALPGVARSGVRLAGRRHTPAARVSLLLEGHAVPDTVVTDLDARVLTDACRSAALDGLPAEVRLHGERHRGARVE